MSDILNYIQEDHHTFLQRTNFPKLREILILLENKTYVILIYTETIKLCPSASSKCKNALQSHFRITNSDHLETFGT